MTGFNRAEDCEFTRFKPLPEPVRPSQASDVINDVIALKQWFSNLSWCTPSPAHMSPSSITPDSTHQLISGDCKTWSGCVRYRDPAGTGHLYNVRLTLDMTSDRRCILVENENQVDVSI